MDKKRRSSGSDRKGPSHKGNANGKGRAPQKKRAPKQDRNFDRPRWELSDEEKKSKPDSPSEEKKSTTRKAKTPSDKKERKPRETSTPADRKVKPRTAAPNADKGKKPRPQRGGKPTTRSGAPRSKVKSEPKPSFSEDVRLNKYLSNAGICSRREADVLISTGVITVNDEVVTEMGFKVKPTDVVKYDGATVTTEIKRYILLNKPKDFITQMDDALGRRTVMQLVAKACREQIWPVDHLERTSTGLLLLSNDSDMIKKLTHPKQGVRKLYHVETSKPISEEQMEKLRKGVEIDGGAFIRPEKVDWVKDGKKKEIGIELTSTKNRVVRRMLEAIGHEVARLDRVVFAGLTKKNLPRGHWRELSDEEITYLKML